MSGRAGGDFDYEANGQGYALQRRPDPRIAAFVHEALGPARSVLNVGAGAGSYEPLDRLVLAVEPSAAMRAQRPPHLAPAIRAVAEDLPFDDLSVDAAMALVTVHQWADLARGLSEMRRVARGPVVVLTFDGDALDRFWLADYVPELVAVERRRYPPIERIGALIGKRSVVRPVPIPVDCRDGFTEAFYARPAMRVRRGCSTRRCGRRNPPGALRSRVPRCASSPGSRRICNQAHGTHAMAPCGEHPFSTVRCGS